MNNEELKTYIKLKYFPIQHTEEYLSQLPDNVLEVIIQSIYEEAVRRRPTTIPFPEIKAHFIKRHESYYSGMNRIKYRIKVETIITEELFKYYSAQNE